MTSRRRAGWRPACEWASDCQAPAAVLVGPAAVLTCLDHYAEMLLGGGLPAAVGLAWVTDSHSGDFGRRADVGSRVGPHSAS